MRNTARPGRGWKSALRGLLLMGLVGGLATARAADAPEQERPGASAPGQPAVVGAAAVKSADAVAALAKEIGLQDVTADQLAGFVNQQFPFLGDNGLATDRPVGFVFFGAPDITPDKAGAFVLPAKAGAAQLKAFTDAGGQEMVGHADTVILNGVAFRRTDNDLIFGGLPKAIAGLKTSSVSDLVKGQNSLVRVSVDLKTVRTSMPDQFKAFLEQVEQGSGPKDKPGEKMGADFVLGLLRDKLDRLEFGIDHGPDGLRLLATAAPISAPKVGAFTKPGLPADTIVRADVAAPLNDIFPFINDEFIKTAMEADQQKPGANKLTPAQERDVRTILSRTAKLFLAADANTVGLTMKDAKTPVVYVVSQYTKAPDFAGGLKDLIDDVKKMAKSDPNNKGDLALSTYAAHGAEVTRLTATENGVAQGYMDAVQLGNSVYLTISPSDAHAIDGLLSLKAVGPMKSLADGWVDLGTIVDVASRDPSNPVGQMPADQRKQVMDLLKGQKLMWSATTGAGNALTFDAAISTTLLKGIVKIAETAHAGGAAEKPNGGL